MRRVDNRRRTDGVTVSLQNPELDKDDFNLLNSMRRSPVKETSSARNKAPRKPTAAKTVAFRVICMLWTGVFSIVAAGAADPVDIGSSRELFVDHYLIDDLRGLELRLGQFRDEGSVFKYDQPWEGAFSGYATVIKDGEVFRLYYRGKPGLKPDGEDEVTCYAESRDGATWTRPRLSLYEFNGSRDNNIILQEPGVTHNFSPFLDTRPGVPRAERFKALGGIIHRNPGGGLFAFGSEDGIHWHKLDSRPVITEGAFDSQNVSFWSVSEQCYVAYFRTFTAGVSTAYEWRLDGLRSVSRATSKDFRKWTKTTPMQFEPPQNEHIYINQTHPYFRAPHLYIGLAVRFMPKRAGISAEQAEVLKVVPAYYKAAKDVSDVVLLTSRGGTRYDRTFREALLRPGLRLQEWVSRANYPALNVVPTGPEEMSVWVNQDCAQPTAHLRRYTLRLDGFASLHAGYAAGQMTTKPLRFSGSRLVLNFATSAAGSLRVEVQDDSGVAIPGFSLEECVELLGNSVEREVHWKAGPDVSRLAGKPVRLRFVMNEADLYSLKFNP